MRNIPYTSWLKPPHNTKLRYNQEESWFYSLLCLHIRIVEASEFLYCSSEYGLSHLIGKLYKQVFLQSYVYIAVVASRQKSALHLIFVCNVGNGICKMHSHILFLSGGCRIIGSSVVCVSGVSRESQVIPTV